MILTEEELAAAAEKLKVDINDLKFQAEGIESFIRDYTNNNFIIRSVRIITPSKHGKLETVSPNFKVGDTVQISGTDLNDGLYVLTELNGTLDRDVLDCDKNIVTLVRYPLAVKLGVVKMLEYTAKTADKVGIASETLSRHSVSYVHSNDNSAYDYPESYISFLKPYMKARF